MRRLFPRRRTKKNDPLIAAIIIGVAIGIPVVLLTAFIANNVLLSVIVLIGTIAGVFGYRKLQEKKRKEAYEQQWYAMQEANNQRRLMLLNQYGDPSLVDRIIQRQILQGDTTDIVHNALGQPMAIENDVLKTKTKETWKYKKGNERRGDQFNFQVKFENGRVVGWEDR